MKRILAILFSSVAVSIAACGGGNDANPDSDQQINHVPPESDLYVSNTGNNANDGRSPNDAMATIQEAIDRSKEGDTIEVLNGIYSGPGNRNLHFAGKTITLKSEMGPETTVIDCEGSGRAFHIHQDETAETVLDGFSIINGVAPMGTYGRNDYEMSYGGAIFVDGASPTLRNLRISGSTADFGGGLALRYSDAAVSDVTIDGNSTLYMGGGLVMVYSNSRLERITITNNHSEQFGGGIVFNTSHPRLNKVTIASNTAGSQGSGTYTTIDYEEYKGLPMSVTTSYPVLTNCIVWNNDINGTHIELFGTLVADFKSNVSLNFSNVENGWEGIGNIDEDPLFNADYSLQAGSPCINSGVAYYEWLDGELTDYNDYNPLDTVINPADVVVDMGPDEYFGSHPEMGAIEFVE